MPGNFYRGITVYFYSNKKNNILVDRIYIIRSYLYIKNHENIERNPNPLPAFDTAIL